MKKIIETENLNYRLLLGVQKVAKVVTSTLGPRGNNVLLHKKDKPPIATKDGVTVSKFTDLDDPVENTAAQILKEASQKTADLAGDGTTTTIVLAEAILKEAQQYLAVGIPPIELKKGIEKATEKVVEEIEKISIPVRKKSDLENIATVSANGDKTIGGIVTMAIDRAGKDGTVIVQDAQSIETSLELIEGFRVDAGYFSPKFITDEKFGRVSYSEPLIMVTDRIIENVASLMPTLEFAARQNKPLLIVADDFEKQPLSVLILNAIQGTLKVCAIKAPEYGEKKRELLKDLCCAVGATLISNENGLELNNIELKHFGKCTKIEISRIATNFIGGNGNSEDIRNRINILKEEIKENHIIQECEAIQNRISRLQSGVSVIKVGGATDVEMLEKKHRIEDALEAVRSAQEEGVVPGGGIALAKISKKLKVKTDTPAQQYGVEVIRRALLSPIQTIAKNSGLSGDVVIEKVIKSNDKNKGYDFAEEKYVDMIKNKIIDPAKVTRCALQNAVSVACILLTSKSVIIEE